MINPAVRSLSYGVYVLKYHGHGLVRRVNNLLDGFEIFGDNPRYRPKTSTLDEARARIQVNGAVVGVLRQL